MPIPVDSSRRIMSVSLAKEQLIFNYPTKRREKMVKGISKKPL